MTILNQPRRRGEFLRGDIDPISFDTGTLLSGQNLQAGTVLGQITNATAVAVAGTNTGNGVMGAVTVGPNAVPGVYTLRITAAAANAGAFTVTDPMGDIVGTGNVAQAHNNGSLSFTLADGSTDFVVGDSFTITVTGTNKWRQLNPTAIDGSQRAAAILYDNEDATAGDRIVTLVTRHQELGRSDLFFPAGITTPQLTTALAQLAAQQLIARA